ncbi:MAG: methyltransferase family protein, partial [Acidobacteriota bacterium]
VVWDVGPGAGRVVLWALFWSGWMLVFISTLLIDHFDLFGLRQVVLHARGRPYVEPRFRVTALYRVVRHPLLLGFIIAFWSAPRMTAGHLIFAAATTLYMLIAISLEERDQAAIHGEPYRAYRAKVPMLIPFLGGKPTGPVRADEP